MIRTRSDHDTDVETSKLAEALRQVLGAMVRMVRARGQTPKTAQLETLGLLDGLGPLTIAGLADRRNVKHQSMRLVVAQLEREGLVERCAAPDDRRAQQIILTRTGAAALSASRQVRARVIAEMLQTLSPEDRQAIAASVKILQRLTNAR